MVSVKVSSELSPSVQVRIAEAMDNPAPEQAPSPAAPAPGQRLPDSEEDLINKNKIISLVEDHHNKIDKLTVTEERGGKKRVQFEVSPQGILRPNAQPGQAQTATAQPAPAPAAPAPAPAAPAMAASNSMTKEAQSMPSPQATPAEMGDRAGRGMGPGAMHSNPAALSKAKDSLNDAVQYLRLADPNHDAIASALRAINILNMESGAPQQVMAPGAAMPQSLAKKRQASVEFPKEFLESMGIGE